MTNILFAPLHTQINALNSGQISSVELVQEHIRRITAINPHINAAVQVASERALSEARSADDARSRGDATGALHGVPFSVKDSLETEGIISAAGTMGRRDFVPQQDAAIVHHLRVAGGIVLAKTNCPELVMPFETDNLVYGRTNNPWALDHTPGGSSGGEGALIAAGGSPLGVAGDAGASIRLPAHFCGITGIKPTTGRVPRTGHIPIMGGATGAMAATGPMARTVADLILVLPLLIGADGIDAACVPVPYHDPDDVRIAGLRIAFYVDNGVMAADDDTAEAVYRAAHILEQAGALIIESAPPDMSNHPTLFDGLFGADGGMRLRQYLNRIGTEQVSDPMQRVLDRFAASQISTADFMTLLGRMDKARAQMLHFMKQFDAVLCPVAAYPAPLHDTLLGDDGKLPLSYTMSYNLVGYPSAAVPVSLSRDGLPIGVQVVAAPWREDIVLAVARAIEQATGGYQPPPMPYLFG